MKGYTHLFDLAYQAALECPSAIAYHFVTEDGFKTLTYQQLHHQAKALAVRLQASSCENERVMLFLPPGLDYIVAFFGCLYAGAIPVPAYPPRRNHHSKRLLAIVENVQAKLIITHPIFAEQSRHYAPNVLVFEHIDDALADQYRRGTTTSPIAFIQYTSGSTNDPKGVMVSHQNIMTNLQALVDHFGDRSEKVCSWLPPYHDMGLIGGVLFPLYKRIPVILMSPTYFLKFPWRWLEIISEEKITTSVAPNFAYDLCVKRMTPAQIKALDLRSWHYALNGAEPVRPETIQRFNETFSPVGFKADAVRPVYGLAEATLMVSAASKTKKLCLSAAQLKQKKGTPTTDASEQTITLISCGQSARDHEIRIVCPETLRPLPDQCIGEIWVYGPSIALGYWQRQELTEAHFHAQLAGDQSHRRYLRTGDLGFIHEGELYITGRAKDVIIIRGMNHYPHDIEQTVYESHPSLQPYATAAFAVENHSKEQLIIMQEVVREHLFKLDTDAIFSAVRSAVLREHGLQVQTILLLKPLTLPKTSSGKVQRFVCRENFYQNSIPIIARDDLEQPEDQVFHWLTEWFKKRSHRDLKLEDTLADLGLDSVGIMELTADLQHWLGKRFDPTVLLEQPSIDQLIGTLLENTSTRPNAPIETPQPILADKSLAIAKQIIYLQTTEGPSLDTIIIDGKKYINYAGYNYLGMSGDPFVNARAIEAIKTYGTSVSASRIASGQKPLHIELEKAISHLIHTEDCVVYSSGHATNVSVITHCFGTNDLILYDELSHNSIVQGASFSGATCVPFPHNHYHALKSMLEKYREKYQKALIVSEGIFSMDGDVPCVPELVALKHQFDALLMLDEAHSIGTLGKTGGGIREQFDLQSHDVDIWMGTLSKAFASCGGYIAGSHSFIDQLKYHAAGFVYSAGISPANTAAALAAIQLMRKQPERVRTLQQRHQLLLSLLKNAAVPTGLSEGTPIIPIVLEDAEVTLDFSLALKKRGIYAIPIIYPAVAKGAARVRLFLNCLHREETIYETAKIIIELYETFRPNRLRVKELHNATRNKDQNTIMEV